MPRTSPKWQSPINTRTYYAWRSMRQRCTNPEHVAYANYGGRGITVCKRWMESFDAFVADMGECPSGLTLERRKNHLGYSPKNCIWAPRVEQMNNQRRNVRVTHAGQNLTVTQWARKLGIRPDTLFRRLERMPAERALIPGSLYGKPPEHGTRAGYESGCRCEICRSTHNARVREQRAKHKEKNVKT